MAFVDVTSDQIADCGTGTHNDETLISPGGLYPSQLLWRDLHPPGVRVLPRGSAPAGSGEINWEDTLGGQFALAIARLEGLLYAVFGSRARAFYLSEQWRKVQWYDGPHPRCLWGPEIWVPHCIWGVSGCGLEECGATCWDYRYGESPDGYGDIKEYVASGGYYSGLAAAFPRPQVPIRSASGDPAWQCRMGTHLTRFFPADCLARTAGVSFPHDPRGHGWFGATNPGRDDAGSNPWLHEGDGYYHDVGEDVTVTYTLPDEAMVPTYVRLWYQTKPPGGAWSGWAYKAMTPAGVDYSATLDAEQHGTQCRWYIEYHYEVGSKPGTLSTWIDESTGIITLGSGHGLTTRDEVDVAGSGWARTAMSISAYDATTITVTGGTGDPLPPAPASVTVSRSYTCYDPGGESLPADADAYSFCWFTHYNPCGRGLPEMLDEDWFGRDIRHGTDYYQFTGDEPVQAELINLLRFALAHLGHATCPPDRNSDESGCAHTYGSVVYWNPRYRHPTDSGDVCCQPINMRWWFSGSAPYPHYRRRGKGDPDIELWDPLDTRPLRNILLVGEDPEDVPPGLEAARRSWRGFDNLYRNDPMDNPHYGGGCSWGTPPAEFVLWYEGGEGDIYAKFQFVGLRPGDVIDPIHIQEIIDAVNDLIDYGVWTYVPVCTRKRTPGTFMGYECGSYYFHDYGDWIYGPGGCVEGHNEYQEGWQGCQKCCANAHTDECRGLSCDDHMWLLKEYMHTWGDSCDTGPWDDEYWTTEGTCDCIPWTKPSYGDCIDPCEQAKCRMTTYQQGSSGYQDPYAFEQDLCVKGYWRYTNCDTGTYPMGQHTAGKQCLWMGDTWHANYECFRRVSGVSYYICTPPAAYNGWDDNHGNTFTKERWDHTWHPGLYVVSTGPSSGNKFGDIFACGDVYPGSNDAVWFEMVGEVNYAGSVPSWLEGCSSTPGCDPECAWDTYELPAELPGYGYIDSWGDPICEKGTNTQGWHDLYTVGLGHQCSADWPPANSCRGETVWVAVDLNLDGTDTPYRKFPGRNGETPFYADDPGIPRLRDYDLDKAIEDGWYDCPCETYTGTGTCGE